VKTLHNKTIPYTNTEKIFGESLPEQIAKHILKKIMKGELLPGDKIVEEYVASELNTSRAPVREALYLLQVDNIVERLPRKGTIVKSFTSIEIREYTEVMVGLIQMALELSLGKWNSEKLQNLEAKLHTMNEMFVSNELLVYQQKAKILLDYLFEVANNKALSRFYIESVYILNVFAQVKWTLATMTFYQHGMETLVGLIKEGKLEEAKRLIPNLLLKTLE
jgi:DNA-binding GntR family transcriptional regulator